MSNDIFEKFNAEFDLEGLKSDIESAKNNSGDFPEIPHGDYEVKVVKIEMGLTGEKAKIPNAPKAVIWFEIVAGEYKGQKIFVNQGLTNGFGIHKTNELLTSLETGLPIEFVDFKQYAELFKQVFNEVDGKAEYQLKYGQNNKGFDTYEIVQRF